MTAAASNPTPSALACLGDFAQPIIACLNNIASPVTPTDDVNGWHAQSVAAYAPPQSAQSAPISAAHWETQQRARADHIARLKKLWAQPCKPNGALEQLLQMGSVCESLPDIDFMPLVSDFLGRVDWSTDSSCGDVDVFELLEMVDSKSPAELRAMVGDCIGDGALHLQAVLDLPFREMQAAFFLEILEAAAKEANEDDEERGGGVQSLPKGSRAVKIFAQFANARTAAEAQRAYDSLLASLALPPKSTLAHIAPLLLPVLPHRSRQLLEALAARAVRAAEALARASAGSSSSSSSNSSQPPPPPLRATGYVLRAAIIGGGPVGLRTAIELATAGVEVEVLEGRDGFSRLQVLHLWEWVEADLIDLGVKYLDPSIFAASDLRRCQTCALQHSLLKIALLLGVKVRFHCHIGTVADLGKLHGHAPLDVLIDASGARCDLLASVGFSKTLALRSARALCVVISLANHETSEELELRESTWSRQFFQSAFVGLETAHGVVLENLVYYRSTGAFTTAATHYFLMTTELSALRARGAVKESATVGPSGEPVDPCRPENIDARQLESYARDAIAAFVPSLSKQPMVPNQLSLFDFSERWQSNTAAAIVPGHGWAPGSKRRVLVTRVGDALQEPFWPEGLGINRGFFHAYDTCDLVARFRHVSSRRGSSSSSSNVRRGLRSSEASGAAAAERASEEEAAFAGLLARREELFNLTKRLSAYTAKGELKPHTDTATRFSYGVAPSSRYSTWAPQRDEEWQTLPPEVITVTGGGGGDYAASDRGLRAAAGQGRVKSGISIFNA